MQILLTFAGLSEVFINLSTRMIVSEQLTFLDHVVFATDSTAFVSFVKTFRDATKAGDALIRDELKNIIVIRAEQFLEC